MELLANDVEENCADEESIPSDDTSSQLHNSLSQHLTLSRSSALVQAALLTIKML